MNSPSKPDNYARCEVENLPKLIEDNACFLYGAQYKYIITTALRPEPGTIRTGPYTGQAARALLVRYHRDGEGKGMVLRMGIHHGSVSEKPYVWRAILDLHTALKQSVEDRREYLHLKEGDEVE